MVGIHKEIHFCKGTETDKFIKRLDAVNINNTLIQEHYYDPHADIEYLFNNLYSNHQIFNDHDAYEVKVTSDLLKYLKISDKKSEGELIN